jgi:MSHA biogenesis protein MshI
MPFPRFWKSPSTRWSAVDAGVPGDLLLVTVDGAGERPRVVEAKRVAGDQWDGLAELLRLGVASDASTVAVLPRSDYQIVQIERPPVPASEIDRSVRWAVASQLDMALDSAVVQTLSVLPPPGDNVDQLYVVATAKQTVRTVDARFKDSRRRLDALDIRETAQRNLTALVARGRECVCSVRVTRLGVQLVFCLDGELLLDRFIAQPLSALQTQDAFDRQRSLERIAQQITMSINHLKERYPAIEVPRVWLCPSPVGAQALHALQPLVKVPLEALDLTTLLDCSAVPALQEEAEQARYFVALGAALRGQVA